MTMISTTSRILLRSTIISFMTTSICVAYNTSSQEPNYTPSHVTAPISHPGNLDIILQKNTYHQPVCFSSGDDININICRDDIMRTPLTLSTSQEEHHMIWWVLCLLSCAYYMYNHRYNRGEEEKEEIISSSPPSATTTACDNKCPIREKARREGLVLYDGNWYNVAKFVTYHPGGEEVLLQYLGSDISFVFKVMHRNSNKIMKYRRPVRAATKKEVEALNTRREEICNDMLQEYKETSSSEEVTGVEFNMKAFEEDTNELYQQFLKDGYFKPTTFWLIQKTALVLLLLFLSICSMRIMEGRESSLISYILPGIFLGLFWHQSGFLMHDAEHHNLVGSELINDILGWMFGTVFLGVNGAWWREEHREHHALLNTYDKEGFKDPQMREDVWIQNKKLISFYGDEAIHFLANFQHILFIPIIFVAGRVGIVIDSTITERKFRPWTILGNVLHILLHYCILSQTSHPLQVYIIASFQQAILSLQLLGNHYTKPWNPVHEATESNYFLWQVLCTQDFKCPTWLRWYYGGLNFHYSHHLFPTLPREYFHLTTPRIKELCQKHDLPFIEIGFIDCVVEMVTNFNEVRKDFAKHGGCGSWLI